MHQNIRGDGKPYTMMMQHGKRRSALAKDIFMDTLMGLSECLSRCPGFARVLVNPAPGDLQEINASMPHPKGTIRVALKKQKDNALQGIIELPEGLSGEYQYQGLVVPLKGGENKIRQGTALSFDRSTAQSIQFRYHCV